MCGIAAIISMEKVNENFIYSMIDSIQHRGPDSKRVKMLYDERVYLGHRRLSILDLSQNGVQPMPYLAGRYWITYNGEIYNYLELRTELELNGYDFISNSDTEIILAAYDFWGKECLNKFNGMWAFVIIDIVENKAFVARDRFGVKPLYYWKSADGFYAFASEIKQFTFLPKWSSKINGQKVYDFLNWGITDHSSETMFSDVQQLRCGEAAELYIDKEYNSLPIYKWYELNNSYKKFHGSIEEAAIEFNKLFIDAVAIRLRADVNIGSCLSGGLDSSSIVCVVNDLLMAQHAEKLQKTISACSLIKKYDERIFIDEVVNTREIKAFYVYPHSNSLTNILDQITWNQDEPFGSTSVYAQWCVFEKAKQVGLKVMLDGQGADEQLAGYHGFFATRFTELFKSMQLRNLLSEVVACKKIHNYGYMFAVKGIVNMLFPQIVLDNIRCCFADVNNKPDWFNWKKLDANLKNPFYELGNKTDNIRDLSIAQLCNSNLQMLLHWEDRNSMAHSVETRLPFLDYRLVEFVLGLPDEFKLLNGETKKILRLSMRNVLPEKIRLRSDKMGFVTPEELWLKEDNGNGFKRHLQLAINNSNGVLKENLNNRLCDIIQGKRKFDHTIWRAISYANWVKCFNVDEV